MYVPGAERTREDFSANLRKPLGPILGVALACREFSMGMTLAGGWLLGMAQERRGLTRVVGLALAWAIDRP